MPIKAPHYHAGSMSAITLVLFILGLALLLAGAELLVRGASRLATTIGISPLVVGLTVVAFCTGSPELAVSVQGALEGETDLAIGNIVGSNIFNILFILGLSAMVAPLTVKMQLIRLDVPIAILASVLVFVLGLSGTIDRLGGLLLFGLLIAYIAFLIWQARRERNAEVQAEFAAEFGQKARGGAQIALNIGLIIIGLAMLVIGSRWLVDGAVTLARILGVSDTLIGLTIVAAGTSLPEIATSVTASMRGERDIAVGNVIGSNIFNIFGVLGLTALAAPAGVPVTQEMLRLEIPAMILATAACAPIFFIGLNVTRVEGATLFGFYIAVTLYLILRAIEHPLAIPFGVIMAIAAAIAFVALILGSARIWRAQHAAGV
jgi:cation:H+ antiporter